MTSTWCDDGQCRGLTSTQCPGDDCEVLREARKERERHRCVGCGYCCKKSTCYEGSQITSSGHGPCPFLSYDGQEGRYWCGLVLQAPEERRRHLIGSLYIGAGCCSSLNSDRTAILNA